MMVHFTTVHEIPRAFILLLSLTHIYYNASFLRRDITQQNTISLTECNLSFPLEQPNQKKNLFPNLNATQTHLAPLHLNQSRSLSSSDSITQQATIKALVGKQPQHRRCTQGEHLTHSTSPINSE